MAAEITGADTAHPHETVANAAGRPIHSASICAGGTTCAADNLITAEDRRLGDYFTVNLDNRGCMMIATGDTTLLDPITHQESPTSHPLFVHQDSGTSLTGKQCGKVASVHHPHHPHHHHHSSGPGSGRSRHHHHHRRAHPRRPRRHHSRGFTG